MAGSGLALAFDGVTYFAGGAILIAMRIPGTIRTGASFLHELCEGWSEFRSRQWLWAIVPAATAANLVSQGFWTVLGPLVADNRLGGASGPSARC